MTTTDPVLSGMLEQWHRCVAAKDMTGLGAILAPDCVFRSPVAHHPYEGAAITQQLLATVVQVFEDFTYDRTLVASDGRSVALEFTARVGDRGLKGIDLIRIDDAGRIVEFEVYVRPISGLMALAAEMKVRTASFL